MLTEKPLRLTLALTLFSGGASAEMGTVWPYQDPGWKPEFNLALTAGQFDPQASRNENGTATGLQLSFNCLWFGRPAGILRQNINLNHVNGIGYDINSLEINPRWYYKDGDLSYGAGPGIGYLWLIPDQGSHADSFTLQFSAAVEYHLDDISLGAGTRYLYTLDQDINNSGEGMNNFLTDIRLGFDF